MWKVESTWTYTNWLKRQEKTKFLQRNKTQALRNHEKSQELGVTSTPEVQVLVELKIEGLIVNLYKKQLNT